METQRLFFLICFIVLFTNIGHSQPDTTENRYATTADASYWPTVNIGDYIFFKGNNDENRAIYANGGGLSIDLTLGKKILIWRGEYRRIFINGDNCESTTDQPTIITNLGGQVKWGYSTAENHYRSLELYNFDYILLTGKYDPINQTGDPNYLGHNEGENYGQGDFHQRYGMWGNPRWSGYRYNGTFSNIVRIRDFESCKISYVAASEGGFAGFNIKSDNPDDPDQVEIDIQDCFSGWTESEGVYISYSTAAENQDLTELVLRNNIFAFCGSESLQTDNLVAGSLIEHNVAFTSACFYRRPFQDYYQDGLHQLSFCEGDVTINNNVMITGNNLHQLRYKYPGPDRVSPTVDKKVVLKNNYYGYARSNIAYVWQGDGVTEYEMDSLVYGPISTPTSRDAYYSTDEWAAYYKLCNNNTLMTMTNTIHPGDRPLYYGACGDEMVDTSNNSTETAPLLEFVNSGFSDEIDYRKFTFWSAEYGTSEKEGISIPYELDDFVFYDDSLGYTRFYKCILAHEGDYDPNFSPTYWELCEWEGNRLPPLDLRMRRSSYYKDRNMGLLYSQDEIDGSGINENNLENSLTLLPNPTNDILYYKIESTIEWESAQLIILDSRGSVIKSYASTSKNGSIDVSNLPNGIYFFSIITESDRIVKRFVKEG